MAVAVVPLIDKAHLVDELTNTAPDDSIYRQILVFEERRGEVTEILEHQSEDSDRDKGEDPGDGLRDMSQDAFGLEIPHIYII